MKKTLMVLSLSFLLASCGSNGGSSSTPSTPVAPVDPGEAIAINDNALTLLDELNTRVEKEGTYRGLVTYSDSDEGANMTATLVSDGYYEEEGQLIFANDFDEGGNPMISGNAGQFWNYDAYGQPYKTSKIGAGIKDTYDAIDFFLHPEHHPEAEIGAVPTSYAITLTKKDGKYTFYTYAEYNVSAGGVVYYSATMITTYTFDSNGIISSFYSSNAMMGMAMVEQFTFVLE